MGKKPTGPEWNKVQLTIAYGLLVEKKSANELMAEGFKKDAVYRIIQAIEKGAKPKTLDPDEIAKAPDPTPFASTAPKGSKTVTMDIAVKPEKKAAPSKTGLVETDSASETQILQFVAHVQKVSMTVNMFISYGCAVKNGFEGTFGDFLDMICLDFWACRGRNMFEEYGQMAMAEEVEDDSVTAG